MQHAKWEAVTEAETEAQELRVAVTSTRFTCVTSTNVQILPPRHAYLETRNGDAEGGDDCDATEC